MMKWSNMWRWRKREAHREKRKITRIKHIYFSCSVVRESTTPRVVTYKNFTLHGSTNISPQHCLHFVAVLMLMTLVTWTKGDQPSRVILATIDVCLHFLFLQYLGSILPPNGDSSPLIGKHILYISTSDPTSLSLYKYKCVLRVKGKGHPITCHEGTNGEQRYSSALDGGGRLTPPPGRFTPWNDPVPIV
jgi:hypothetical protein